MIFVNKLTETKQIFPNNMLPYILDLLHSHRLQQIVPGAMRYPFQAGMKISDISVDISLIYPISVMFDTISTSDISDIGDV